MRDNAPNVFFLIIGERQSAAPYLELAEERPLFLSEILKSNDWISCSDAHTFCPTDGEWFYRSQVTTDYAVSMMLTPLSRQSEVRRFYDVPNLFDFARAGGYGSFFCSSQLQWRGFLVNIRLLGDCADETEWLKSEDAARQMPYVHGPRRGRPAARTARKRPSFRPATCRPQADGQPRGKHHAAAGASPPRIPAWTNTV